MESLSATVCCQTPNLHIYGKANFPIDFLQGRIQADRFSECKNKCVLYSRCNGMIYYGLIVLTTSITIQVTSSNLPKQS